jgi:hypothetical protein
MLQAAASPGPELRDIHLPAPPSWWPPAPGWWLLAFVVVAVSIFSFVYLYKKTQRARRCQALLAEFERTVAVVRSDAPALAAALSAFLRRQDLRAAAGLRGEAWLAHLDARIGSDEYRRGVGRVLIDAPYRARADYDAAALIALARRTVRATFEQEAAHA